MPGANTKETDMDTAPDAADEQAARWNGVAGRAWVETQELLDRMYEPLEKLLVETVAAASARRVLDVGCGAGGTTLAVARLLGPEGRCVGIDISEPMITAARARAERERSPARFIRANALDHAFEPASFDMIISRFGVMFFDDSVAEPPARCARRRHAAVHRVAQRCGESFHDDGRTRRGAHTSEHPAPPAGRARAVRTRGRAAAPARSGGGRLGRDRRPSG
jgi:SAM-dependent methyltransferase